MTFFAYNLLIFMTYIVNMTYIIFMTYLTLMIWRVFIIGIFLDLDHLYTSAKNFLLF